MKNLKGVSNLQLETLSVGNCHLQEALVWLTVKVVYVQLKCHYFTCHMGVLFLPVLHYLQQL